MLVAQPTHCGSSGVFSGVCSQRFRTRSMKWRQSQPWACPDCTFFNDRNPTICEICRGRRTPAAPTQPATQPVRAPSAPTHQQLADAEREPGRPHGGMHLPAPFHGAWHRNSSPASPPAPPTPTRVSQCKQLEGQVQLPDEPNSEESVSMKPVDARPVRRPFGGVHLPIFDTLGETRWQHCTTSTISPHTANATTPPITQPVAPMVVQASVLVSEITNPDIMAAGRSLIFALRNTTSDPEHATRRAAFASALAQHGQHSVHWRHITETRSAQSQQPAAEKSVALVAAAAAKVADTVPEVAELGNPRAALPATHHATKIASMAPPAPLSAAGMAPPAPLSAAARSAELEQRKMQKRVPCGGVPMADCGRPGTLQKPWFRNRNRTEPDTAIAPAPARVPGPPSIGALPGAGGLGYVSDEHQTHAQSRALPVTEATGSAHMPATEAQSVPIVTAVSCEEIAAGHTCILCFDSGLSTAQTLCCSGAEPHHMCHDCFEEHVWHSSLDNVGLLTSRNAHIVCPMSHSVAGGCDASPYPRHQIESAGPRAVDAYQAALKKIEEVKHTTEATQTELTPDFKSTDVNTHRMHIVESILTLQCPNCTQAFVDFAACCALTCARCNTNFCAFCLKQSSPKKKCHEHVTQCQYNPNPGTTLNGKDLFVSFEVWSETARLRQRRMLQEYLVQLDATMVPTIIAALKVDLRHLGLEEACFTTKALHTQYERSLEEGVDDSADDSDDDEGGEDFIEGVDDVVRDAGGGWIRVNGRWRPE